MKEGIVIPAWEIARTNSQVKIFNLFPSILSTLYLFLLTTYQVAWTYIYIFDLKDEFFSQVVHLAHSSYFWVGIILFLWFLLLFIFLVPLSEWWLIALIDRIDKKHDHPWIWFAFKQWLQHFLPIFELNNFMSLFKLISIITFFIFLIRLFGMRYIGYIISGVGGFFIIAVIVNIFLAYTRFFVVLEWKKAMEAIVASVDMTLTNMGITVRLYLSLLLVYIRTILTVLIFIVVPFFLSALLTYITVASIKYLFFFIACGLIFWLLILIAHLNSVLEIFVETLWYRAYMENKIQGEWEKSIKV